MKLNLIVFVFFYMSFLSAQQTVSGRILTSKGYPIVGANIYLEGTYAGATSDDVGYFSFSTNIEGKQILVVSYLSFETYRFVGMVADMVNLEIRLKDDVDALDAVVLSAGTFSAGDNSKVNVLKPLDVVTTASALGDFVGALQTLPGTTTVAEDGRLFVRGGDASETQIFIDGIRVFTPYTPTTNNAPTRGRYSPFLFDGITFSTGGYSAEYGQALSSVLLLNTIDEPDQEKTDLGIMSVGAALGNTQKWESSSLSFNVSYINLAPYNAIFKNRNNFIKPFQSGSGETVFRKKTASGLFKLYGAFDTTGFELIQEDINIENGLYVKLKNSNFYLNSSYQGILKAGWSMQGGLSVTKAKNNMRFGERFISDTEASMHAKIKFKNRVSNRFKLYLGAEYFLTDFTEVYSDETVEGFKYGYESNLMAAFAESDLFLSKNLAFKLGLRAEYHTLFHEITWSPRLSAAYKISKASQISMAYGGFYQAPNSGVLKFDQSLNSQQANHYILNYQYNRDRQIFRAEAYYKHYKGLVKHDAEFATFESDFSNSGYGFAKGLDVFWRDGKSLKNFEYWLSYSFLDTKRDYRDFPELLKPGFANTHNVSFVGKYWVDDWKSQLGFSYAFASGRTFTNPNKEGFLNDVTKSYNSLSVNWAYLISPQKILYASVNNVLDFKNINGYQYADAPNSSGFFENRALRPAVDQFFFVGFFWTISDDKKSNQLNNL